MAAHEKKNPESLEGSFNAATQRVWVAALGRFGTPALSNPWNGYHGDYSDPDLLRFGLGVRRSWLDKHNQYLTAHALGFLAKNCKEQRVRELGRHLEGIFPDHDCLGAELHGL